MEMVLILVNEGVELRNESAIEKGSLRELCEAVSAPFTLSIPIKVYPYPSIYLHQLLFLSVIL